MAKQHRAARAVRFWIPLLYTIDIGGSRARKRRVASLPGAEDGWVRALGMVANPPATESGAYSPPVNGRRSAQL